MNAKQIHFLKIVSLLVALPLLAMKIVEESFAILFWTGHYAAAVYFDLLSYVLVTWLSFYLGYNLSKSEPQ